MSQPFYPPPIRRLMAAFRREMQSSCPDAKVRLSYTPAAGLDVLVEVFVTGRPLPSTLLALGRHLGRILSEGYAVRVVVRDAREQADAPAEPGGRVAAGP